MEEKWKKKNLNLAETYCTGNTLSKFVFKFFTVIVVGCWNEQCVCARARARCR